MNAGQKADAAAVLERARQRAIARAEIAEAALRSWIPWTWAAGAIGLGFALGFGGGAVGLGLLP